MPKKERGGSIRRYGVRYGKSVKDRIRKIEKEQRKRHRCPDCLKPSLKRVASGVWVCKKCGLKIAGDAYNPGLEKE